MTRLLSFGIAVGVFMGPRVAAAAEGEGSGGSGLLEINPGQAIWNLAWFLLLAFILGKFVWPKILSALQARESKIRQDIASAKQANEQAQQTLEQYRQQLSDAQAEAQRIIDQSREDAEKLRAQMTKQTEQEIAQMRQRATEEIRLAKQEAIDDLQAKAAELATDVAEKILRRSITDQDARDLVQQSLGELKEASGTNGGASATKQS